MKIKVKDILANPYRDFNICPLDPYKIDELVGSIGETEFWENFLVRPHPEIKEKYQLAYGHHRFEAVKKSGIKEVDNIPIKNLDDAMMIKIMANENMDQWATNPKVVNESVRVAREYLNTEFKKAKDIKDLPRAFLKLKALKGRGSFAQIQNQNIGRPILLEFLGSNWKGSMIDEALRQLDSEKGMKEAFEVFDIQADAKAFRKTTDKDSGDIVIPKGKEKATAKKVAAMINERKKETASGMSENFKRKNRDDKKVKPIRGKTDKENDVKVFTRMVVENISEKEARLKDISSEIKTFNLAIKNAYSRTSSLNALLKELEVNEVGGLKSIFVIKDIEDLLKELKIILSVFGYDTKLQNNLLN
uniref:ParB-like N-terminal domain-containing protein n=1 Tax=viral metagenome TaxID=1070528 RepID=A0A6M3KYJ6_9ZZZZ